MLVRRVEARIRVQPAPWRSYETRRLLRILPARCQPRLESLGLVRMRARPESGSGLQARRLGEPTSEVSVSLESLEKSTRVRRRRIVQSPESRETHCEPAPR